MTHDFRAELLALLTAIEIDVIDCNAPKRFEEAVSRAANLAATPTSAPVPVAEGGLSDAHPDDLAVDKFAAAMKDKLARSRAKGRSGWQTATARHLSRLLVDHLTKGDPVDIGNFAMMLHQNGQFLALRDRPLPSNGELIALARSRSPWKEWMSAGGSLASAWLELAELLRDVLDHYGTPTPAPIAEGGLSDEELQDAFDAYCQAVQAALPAAIDACPFPAGIRAVWDLAIARYGAPTPAPLPPSYIDECTTVEDRTLLETFYTACRSEGGTADEIYVRGIRAVLALADTPTPAPVPVAERLPGDEHCCSHPRRQTGHWCWGLEVRRPGHGLRCVWRLMERMYLRDEAESWLPHWALPLPAAAEHTPPEARPVPVADLQSIGATLARIAQDMRGRGIAEEASGTELLRLAAQLREPYNRAMTTPPEAQP